ncbi:hypothetical protein [Flavobacterium sp.]|jgi:hypothetical protein|uniref:hypothetical protein n=1 Tax=Flavobacterium sp. TaxID=239 RepID=UPI0037BF39D7
MKTIIPNVLFNHQANFWLDKKRQIMKHKLLLVLTLVSFCQNVLAQSTKNGEVVIREISSFLTTASSGSTARATSEITGINTDQLRNLVTTVQPSIYFFQGVVKTYGNAPTKLYTDASSLSQVNNLISEKQDIEIVTIRINTESDLSSFIDLSVFSNFTNLKYIYILSNVETTESVIVGLIQNNDERFSLFYKIGKGA